MCEWPFDEPENVATLTVRQVTHGGQPILIVARDAVAGMWQFHTGGPFDMADALIVALQEVFHIDPSIGELADLPPGWKAQRSAPGQPWRRQPA